MLRKDIEAGRDACERNFYSSWWNWDKGSCPFHWRWRTWYQERIRDGVEVHFSREPPKVIMPQREIREPDIKEKVIKKLCKVLLIGYMVLDLVASITSFFPVPKGKEDICMVYVLISVTHEKMLDSSVTWKTDR